VALTSARVVRLARPLSIRTSRKYAPFGRGCMRAPGAFDLDWHTKGGVDGGQPPPGAESSTTQSEYSERGAERPLKRIADRMVGDVDGRRERQIDVETLQTPRGQPAYSNAHTE